MKLDLFFGFNEIFKQHIVFEVNVLKVKGAHVCYWQNDFNLKTVSPNADEQVQNASVHWRGGRSEDTHGEQLQASAAPQRQKSVLL